MIKYGLLPVEIGIFEPVQPEMMFYLYLPVKLPQGLVAMPRRMRPFGLMLEKCSQDFVGMGGNWTASYVYMTVKTMFVQPGQPGNREGWHADGFGSGGDINYIWCDKNPTEFAIGEFGEISTDDQLSMQQMAENAGRSFVTTYPVNTLLRLDESVVHRVSEFVEPGVRRFVKITISRHIFNNEGNSRNYALDCNWTMIPRAASRNLDSKHAA